MYLYTRRRCAGVNLSLYFVRDIRDVLIIKIDNNFDLDQIEQWNFNDRTASVRCSSLLRTIHLTFL